MTKTLEQRIADRVNQAPRVKSAAGKVTFLALKDEIAQAVKSGWPVTEIWKTLHAEGHIAVGYHTFNLYVNKYIREPVAASAAASAPTQRPAVKEPTPQLSSGFKINPSPKKEDII